MSYCIGFFFWHPILFYLRRPLFYLPDLFRAELALLYVVLYWLDVLDPLVFICGCLLYLKGGSRGALPWKCLPFILFTPKFSYNSFKLSIICIGNSMICSDIWHKYHEWYFEIVIRNSSWDNFEISQMVFMPNITYKSCYYLFILLSAKGL